MIKQMTNLEEILNFAWPLSQSQAHASYHRIEKKQDLIDKIHMALTREHHHIIGAYNQETLVGLAIYFGIRSESYAQTIQFLIEGPYDQVAQDLIGHIQEDYKGCDLLIPMPASNEDANRYLSQHGFTCIETSYVTHLEKRSHSGHMDNPQIRTIEEDTFDDYAPFHDRFALPLDMYYTSERMKAGLKHMQVYAYVVDGEIVASIFARGTSAIMEIYGLFIEADQRGQGIEVKLINHLLNESFTIHDTIDQFIYFVDESEEAERKAALSCGFVVKDICKTYRSTL